MMKPAKHKANLYSLHDLQSTDLLAFREVAEQRLLSGRRVLDFGCGTGRSSRFLSKLGKDVTGVDANPYMIEEAKAQGGHENYLYLPAGSVLPFEDASFDSFFASWVLMEAGDSEAIVSSLKELRRVIKPGGSGVVIANTPDFYSGSWVSNNVNFPENAPPLSSGQKVKVQLLPSKLEIIDYFWCDTDYSSFFDQASLQLRRTLRPLGRSSDGILWIDELTSAPYVIYHLKRGD